MRSSLVVILAVTVPVAVAVACGGGQPAPVAPPAASTVSPTPTTPDTSATDTTSASASASASTSASVAEVPTMWSDSLTKEQMVAMMKTRVIPAMTPVFQGEDAKRYADFGCKTCHGPEFKDPKEFLPHLHLAKDKLVEFDKKPKIAKFMAEKVAPEMAKALGLPHYDPATKQGFGCGGCHTIDMK
jgi:hypothetical protein